MSDIRIATDYLQDLFEKLYAEEIDLAQVDWPFAEKAWRVVREELAALRREQASGREPQPVPQWLLDQHGVRLRPCPFCEAFDAQLVSFGASSAELDMRYFVQCEKCSARGPITLYSQEAVMNWNYAREARDAALEAVRAWELASELEMKTWPGEGG